MACVKGGPLLGQCGTVAVDHGTTEQQQMVKETNRRFVAVVFHK